MAEFILNFMDNLLALHQELAQKTYRHGPYFAFKINDPKPRDIHKASVRDRLVHNAFSRILCPFLDRYFIYDSYSCRLKKGTHRAINRLGGAGRKVSQNHTRTAWILKGDIRKFFANIDHTILKQILKRYIADTDILWLLEQLIDSFNTKGKIGVGLPLGNLTSQLFINIYMNEFDQYVKRILKIRYYLRYEDDIVILHERRAKLLQLIPILSTFLETKLKLTLHPEKLFLKTLASGVDFLGWVQFPYHRILRTATKRRMFRKLREKPSRETIVSYLGMLRHGNTHKIVQSIKGSK